MAEITYPGLHRWHHDDYDKAKLDIFRQLGDLSGHTIFGRQVLLAIYIRPVLNPATGIYSTEEQQNEDIAQGKTMMVLQCGPSAFKGDDDWLMQTYGDRGPPKVGDWVWARQNQGELCHLCLDRAERVTYEDPRRRNVEPANSYPWIGWPCRVLVDESLIGHAGAPHHIV